MAVTRTHTCVLHVKPEPKMEKYCLYYLLDGISQLESGSQALYGVAGSTTRGYPATLMM